MVGMCDGGPLSFMVRVVVGFGSKMRVGRLSCWFELCLGSSSGKLFVSEFSFSLFFGGLLCDRFGG